MSSEPPTARKLSKKEKKAQAFRDAKKGGAAGGKGQGRAEKVVLNEEDAVPEAEDLAALEAGESSTSATPAAAAGKKRKRAADDDGAVEKAQEEEQGKEGEGEGEGADEQPKKKKRQRGKTPAQRAREAREKAREQEGAIGEGGEGGAAGAAEKSRLLLFVGNLPYKVTVEEIQAHFEPCGEKPTVRLLTPKPSTSSSGAAQSKGCAFLEFTSGPSLQSALRLHQSTLNHRKINVELTAGGGGNSAARKAKIEEQRKKLTSEREKAAKNKRLKEGESEDGLKIGRWKLAAEKQAGGDAPKDGEAEAEGKDGGEKKKKVRDRRLNGKGGEKAAREQKAKEERLAKASSGANAIKLASGWGNKSGGK
ncbi:hypothetical protein JCM10213_005134 [Rhodosporidiobolus nylandii]